MRIHTRFLLFLLVSIVLYALALQALRRSAERISTSLLDMQMQEHTTHLDQTVVLERAPMEKGIFDNTFWDDMVRFVQTRDAEWARQNIENAFPNFGLQFVWVYDPALTPVYSMPSRAGDPSRLMPDPALLRTALAGGWFRHFYAPSDGTPVVEYLTAPIQPSADDTRSTPPQGYLVGGRLVDRAYLERLAGITGSDLSLAAVPADGPPRNRVDPNSGMMEIYMPLHGADGAPLALLMARHRNESLAIVRQALQRFNWFYLAFAALNLGMLTALVFAWVTVPLGRVSESLDQQTLAPVTPYLEAQHEFGVLARLIRNFFDQRAALMGEIEMRKQYEAHLREARDQAHQSAKAKTDFLSVMSHELRTPLNAVIGLAALLLDQHPRADQVEHLETLKLSAENLLALINDVLDFNKMDAGKVTLERRVFDLRELLSGLLRTFAEQARARGLSLTGDLAADLPPHVIGDPLRLTQVLVNLLSNAVKFTDRGGVTLAVSVGGENAGRPRLTFRVSDTGIGIAADKRGQIFELFSQGDGDITRRFGGTGLGLTIVQRLVALMGGAIVVDSELGVGSTFRFTIELERTDAAPASEPAPADIPVADFRGRRVLVVEDNEVNRRLAVTFLRRWGAEVDTAEHGAAAVVMAAARPYDMILMDLQMPQMSGLEATEQIRRQFGGPNARTPIIAFTATSAADQGVDLAAAGFDGCITKPIEPADLRAAIAHHMVFPASRQTGSG